MSVNKRWKTVVELILYSFSLIENYCVNNQHVDDFKMASPFWMDGWMDDGWMDGSKA